MTHLSGDRRSSGLSENKNALRQFLSILFAHKNAWMVFLLFAFIFAYFYHEPGYNGNSRMALTAAIVEEGRLTIDSFHETSGFATGDKSFYNGHYYTDKAIGSSLLSVPPYAVIYWVAGLFGRSVGPWLMAHLLTFIMIGLPSALMGAIVYIFCERVSGSPLRAGIVTVAVVLGSLAFPFSVVFFGHQLVAALLWISFFLIFRLRSQAHPPAPAYTFLIGLLLGLALISEYPAGVIVLLLAGYYLYSVWLKRAHFKISTLLFPALGGLVPLLFMFGYNISIFGQPVASAYSHLVDPNYQVAMSKGFMGIGFPDLTVLFFETFQPAMGLFWQSPVFLMVFPGAYYILRNKAYRVEGILALSIVTVQLLISSGYFEWWGGHSAGPRHIIPMLPFLCLPLIFLPRKLFPLLTLLTAVSFAQMLIISASEVVMPALPMNNFRELAFFEYSTIYSFCLPELLKGNFTWNLGMDWLGLSGWTSLLLVVLPTVAMLLYFWWVTSKRPELNNSDTESLKAALPRGMTPGA